MAVPEMMLALLAIFMSFSLLPSPVTSNEAPPDITSWCSQTPYPKPCEYFLSHLPPSSVPKKKSDFKKIVMQLAMDRALKAQSHTRWLGDKCRNHLEKVAWADCLELYENTILQLNHTINPTAGCTDVDAQTWLSTALTSLDTCQTGFIELGAAEYMLPLMSNNVSKLICNSLAINNPLPSANETHKGGYPSWVRPGERKLLQASATPASQANLVVAKDGSGNFKTIKAAVDAASKRKGSGRFVIYVKAGVYKENVVIGNNMDNIMFVGDGIGKTIVTGSKSVGGGSTTFDSATFAIIGSGFIARDVTFQNTAGAAKHQAVALRSGSDLSVFYRCSFEGYQDTLYVHSQRQFYKECDIYGTVDFIFGNAAVVFQNCNIYVRRPMSGQQTTVTAQGRMDPNQNTGISIHNSRVTAASDLRPVQGSVKSYLGRPWKEYSRTVYMQTFLDSLINPAGWLEWSGNFALNTLYYVEYMNTGPGSSTDNRVKWRGYNVITNPTEVSQFTVENFISGGSWIPSAGVPFTSSL
ncbi:pectinesterase 2-like [Magnolia sinica]|uniref:pectinesterase 2-like n=1 Tax=Magnolia sinica TaxID=86752 RepID=UPI0026587E10|nr:pectinesterase 2-like [Magnolia sinica]